MRSSSKVFSAVLVGLLALPVFVRAYTAESLSLFQAGKQAQAAGQLRAAVQSFRAAVNADPTLTVAYKALGTVYYQAGDHKGALFFYDRYLTTNPQDTATQAFADRIRASLGGSAPAAPVAAQASANAGPFIPGFDVRLAVGAVDAGAGDINKIDGGTESVANSGGTQTNAASAIAPVFGLGTDYGFSNGFVAGFDILDGPSRSQAVTATFPDGMGGNDTAKDAFDISQFTFMLTPGWRFKFGASFVLEPRLGLGYEMMTVKETVSFDPSAADQSMGETSASESASGSGSSFVVWPEVRGEYLFGKYGLGASLGYMMDSSKNITLSSPSSGSGGSTASSSGPPEAFATSGLSFSIYGVWHFQPLF